MFLNRLIGTKIFQNTLNLFPTFSRNAAVKFDSGFSDQEVEQFKVIFDKFDCEEKGTLDRWQFNTLIVTTMGRKLNAVDLFRVFKRIDSNNDDRLQFEELLMHLARRLKKPPEEDLRRAFNIFDKDNDGRVTLSETRLALLFLGEDYGNPRVRNVFIKLDKDNDGEINYKDFIALFNDEYRKKSGND